MKAAVTLYLDERRPLKNGTFSLKLRIYLAAKIEKWYATDYNLTKEQYQRGYLTPNPPENIES